MSEPRERNAVEKGTLYLVATPIGNLSDISERAEKVLAECDFVAAEDTRNSGLLLARLGMKRPMVSYHEHNRASAGPAIVERLKNGESCALVTDAGTPAISDPGEDLVRLCAAEGIRVVPVPGCCAAVSALSVSALRTRRFFFEGFLPVKGKERKERIAFVSSLPETVIIYEAPHRLRGTLGDLCEAFGEDRRASVCRELTKLNEEVIRGTLGSIRDRFADDEPRGEFVLVIEGAPEVSSAASGKAPEELVAEFVAAGMSEKDAIKAAAQALGVPKSEVYSAVKIKK
ncbi:MAG: 16S rRNA (cytidine(1402)-2'-O)-methyltransferase [Clostridia bacterium]|nr:16S rRNA (cytidine(1402)-2'-O)-methyltransferase [Clostridia bacterium]